MPNTRDGGRSPWQFSSFLARASGGLFETATTIAINFLVLRSGSRLLHPAQSIEICYVIAPDPVLLRAHGSFLTPRWRRESRANPSLKARNFPASSELTGIFRRLGLSGA